MPQTMANAFNNAVLQYLDSPAQLNVILYGLDLVRRTTNQQAASQPTAGLAGGGGTYGLSSPPLTTPVG